MHPGSCSTHAKQKWGRIINITSIASKQPINDLIISSTIRPGILGLAKVLANQYAKDGILINNVAPGYILTARQKEIGTARAKKRGVPFEQYIEELAREVPVGRYGEPEELANVIAFLGSERASFINGTTISVDGGLYRGLFSRRGCRRISWQARCILNVQITVRGTGSTIGGCTVI